jgi:hypothetical protein
LQGAFILEAPQLPEVSGLACLHAFEKEKIPAYRVSSPQRRFPVRLFFSFLSFSKTRIKP